MNYNLALPFLESARKFPDAPAINADGKNLSYRDALQHVLSVADWLRSQQPAPMRVGILGSRSSDACIGILAAAWIGAAYVPINLAFPEAALVAVIKRSGLSALIVDKEGSKLLSPEVMAACPSMILAHRYNVPGNSRDRVTPYTSLNASPVRSEPHHLGRAAPGYILYTSGSTGIPKGVVVPVGAVEHLLRVLDAKYALRSTDRVAGPTAITFDLSVYDMFAAWRAGACLHILSPKQMLVASRFIRDHQVTVWLSVPSIATLMYQMKQLKRGAFPSLRQTFFCGEPLLGSIATEWQKAAPHSTITNMYGPTEATVMFTGEDFNSGCAMSRDIVAIGRPFEGLSAAVATPEFKWLPQGERGELLLSGPQLALGYLDDPEKTKAKFVEIDGECWYRTGDLALRDSNGVLHYLGRIDNQVKVLGYRVELEEIEFHLREVSGCESVAAIAWPQTGGSATGLVAFLSGFSGYPETVKDALARRLPAYMVPNQFHLCTQLPLNGNGKVDRTALAKLVAAANSRSI